MNHHRIELTVSNKVGECREICFIFHTLIYFGMRSADFAISRVVYVMTLRTEGQQCRQRDTMVTWRCFDFTLLWLHIEHCTLNTEIVSEQIFIKNLAKVSSLLQKWEGNKRWERRSSQRLKILAKLLTVLQAWEGNKPGIRRSPQRQKIFAIQESARPRKGKFNQNILIYRT